MGDNEDSRGTGYAADFLGTGVDVPAMPADLLGDAILLNGSEVIPYTHFSLAQSKARGFARWVAWNIDGGSLQRLPRKGIAFTKDPRLPDRFQNGDELYGGNRLDRGHIARRADLVWGPLPDANSANKDSFYFTNIAPQMDDFNQSSKNGVWGRLEEAVFADVDVQDLKVTALGGPVFQDTDREYRGVRMPREFWKILAYVEDGTLKSSAFLLTQNINPFESLDFDEFRAFQVTTAELEDRTGLRFAGPLHGTGSEARLGSAATRAPLAAPADIRW